VVIPYWYAFARARMRSLTRLNFGEGVIFSPCGHSSREKHIHVDFKHVQFVAP